MQRLTSTHSWLTDPSASEVTTLWRYRSSIIIIIIIIIDTFKYDANLDKNESKMHEFCMYWIQVI